MGNVLSRLSELAGLASDPTKNASDRALYQQEFSSLQDQLRATIGGTTAEIGGTSDVSSPLGSFNGVALFGSTAAGGQTVTVGAASGEMLTIPDVNLRSGSMLGLISQDGAGAYALQLSDPATLATIDGALQQLGAGQATLGAAESRLAMTAAQLSVEGENLSASLSSIRDVDVATESTAYAKYGIKVQASTAMLAQANQDPAAVLQLLRA
jgi:flagellin